jgi:hypothetical protein
MENVYTCSCGNQTWMVLENSVRCTACNEVFTVAVPPVVEFNHMVLNEVLETEEA